MSKIANLPAVANPDGSETVLVLKDGVAKRVAMASLVTAAVNAIIAAATDGLNAILAAAAAARDLSRAYAIAPGDAPIAGAVSADDRSAKFWSDRTAENYGQLPGAYADLVAAQLSMQTTVLTHIASNPGA